MHPVMLSVRFGAAESDTGHHCMHTRPYDHSISTLNMHYKLVVVPHMYAETPQCQIRRRQICLHTYGALLLTSDIGYPH